MEPRKKVVELENLPNVRRSLVNGNKVVLTSGCFDLIHGGHVEHLCLSKQQGQVLVVGINSDAFVQRLKGPSRPIRGEEDRAFLMAALGMVDYVTVFNCDYALIEAVQPDIYVTSNNSEIDIRDDTRRMEILSRLGVNIVELPYSKIDSTTRIIHRSISAKKQAPQMSA